VQQSDGPTAAIDRSIKDTSGRILEAALFGPDGTAQTLLTIGSMQGKEEKPVCRGGPRNDEDSRP
jgi:hypothetical protein